MRSGETVFLNASNAALISAPTNGMKPPGRSVGPVPEARRVKKPSGGLACFRSAGANRAEYNPMEHPVRVLHRQSQDRAAAADLNIIGMTTQTQNLARFARRPVQTQGNHATAGIPSNSSDRPDISAGEERPQTFQGGWPKLSSSRLCLSLNVSMHCQKHLVRCASRARFPISR